MNLLVEDLKSDEKLLVLIGMLIDGEAAPLYLSPGSGHSMVQEASKQIAGMDPELRVALSGTLLREEVQRLIRE